MTCLLYGNCHMSSLAQVLNTCPEFSKKYKCKPCLVHEITKSDADQIFKEHYDLVIYQNISKDYRGLGYDCESFKCEKIRLTNAYYQGYFPDSGYLYSKSNHYGEIQDLIMFYRWMWKVGGVKNPKIEYCSYEFPEGKLPVEQEKFYASGYNLQEHHLALAKLDWRDDLFQADIRVTNFIRQNFRKKRLFHTMNHPTLSLFEEEARQILTLSDIEGNVNINGLSDPMNFFQLPIYQATQKNLNLEFNCPAVYRRNNITYTPQEEYNQMSKFYQDMPSELRDENLQNLISKRISFW